MSDGPFILAIEISNPGAEIASGPSGSGVAIGRLGPNALELLGIERVRPSGRGGLDDDLMPALHRLSQRAGFDPRSGSLARVAVSIGPGGYTSVRVACAAAKMIAEATGARCVGVPTAGVVAESLPVQIRSGVVAVALASKGESAWVQVFDNGVEREPGRLMTATDIPSLSTLGVRVLLADRFLPALMRSAADRSGIHIDAPVLDAGACLRLGARLPTFDPADLVPLYPREPDAVTLWRARNK